MSAGDLEFNMPLREALLDTLKSILSPHHEVRRAAEERAKVLEFTEDYAIQLLEVTVDPEYHIALRQLASVMFYRFIESHWNPDCDVYIGPTIAEELKNDIKQILPLGLKEPIRKIRTSVASTLSFIAWSERGSPWPHLFDNILLYITSGDECAVDGALCVMWEMCFTLHHHICVVPSLILFELINVMNEPKFSAQTRCRAIEVFVAISIAVDDEIKYNDELKSFAEVADQTIPDFYQTLVETLMGQERSEDNNNTKRQLIKALITLLLQSKRKLIGWLPQLLPSVWKTLTISATEYSSCVVENVQEERRRYDTEGDGESVKFLVYSIFELISRLLDFPELKDTLELGLPDIFYYAIFYSQISAEQYHSWMRDPNQFIEDESGDTYTCNMRRLAQDVVRKICTEFKYDCMSALTNAISKHIDETVSKKLSAEYGWRIHEACMLTLGTIRDVIHDDFGPSLCDIPTFTNSFVVPHMKAAGFPFLLGRCLLFGSRYADLLSSSANLEFIDSIYLTLQRQRHPCARIAAVSAFAGFCKQFSNMKNLQYIVTSYLPAIIDPLVTLATMYSNPVLRKVLEAIVSVIVMDQTIAASVEPKVSQLTVSVLVKYSNDPELSVLIQQVFKTLCSNPLCAVPMQQRLVPMLLSILSAPKDKVSPALLSATLDILQKVVRYTEKPLNNYFIETVFLAVVRCVTSSEESVVLQSGGECVRAFISGSADQIINYTEDMSGYTGLSLSLHVLARLLNPFASDCSALYVGRFVITLVSKAGTVLGENLDQLLKAVLSKMQFSENTSVIQSLVLVYAYLVHTQLDAVLNFLTTVPGPTGESALKFVLTEWCCYHHLFGVGYEGKICIIALSRLLYYGMATQDPRLDGIQITADTMSNNDSSEGESRPNEAWIPIPLYIKIMKLLVYSLGCLLDESKEEARDDDSEIAEIGYNNSDIDTDTQSTSTSASYEPSSANDIIDRVPPHMEEDLEEEDEDIPEEEDPDALEDPIYHIDIRKYIVDFCNSLTHLNGFNFLVGHMSRRERKILAGIGIPILH